MSASVRDSSRLIAFSDASPLSLICCMLSILNDFHIAAILNDFHNLINSWREDPGVHEQCESVVL
jgi:hypothetical protein